MTFNGTLQDAGEVLFHKLPEDGSAVVVKRVSKRWDKACNEFFLT